MIGAIPVWLALAFLAAALLYASVGFGGGSTYAALLALAGLDYRLLPMVALACNIIVVTGGTVRFARAGLIPWRGALTITALAAPAAFLGGLTPIGQGAFMTLLGASLLLTSASMLLPIATQDDEPAKAVRFAPVAAAPIGYLAGLVGIGGGIFLAPVLHLMNWKNARAIAATASFFILVNSLFGLAGQLLKQGPALFGGALTYSLPLLIAVVIGGQVGSLMAVKILPKRWIRWLTAILVAAVGLRLLFA